MKKKIALINQRFGLEVNGGSEYYTRLIAGMLSKNYDVEVLTTRALNYDTWENYYPEGIQEVDGIKVRRFSVDCTRNNKFVFRIIDYLLRYIKNSFLEMKWIKLQGPKTTALIKYIKKQKNYYDIFIFVTYLYYPTVKGLRVVNGKSIFIPTAHDEPYIHFNIYKRLFTLPKAIIYLTEEERNFVNETFHNGNIHNDVIGIGVNLPPNIDNNVFCKKFNFTAKYIIYVGRIDIEKGCEDLFNYFIEYKEKNPESVLKLVLAGKTMLDIPKHSDIEYIGFISEEDKFNAISGAKALILPSEYESLSISVLEALALGVPVLVNGKCKVLKGHCEKSLAGFYYNDCDEFEKYLNKLLYSSHEYYNKLKKNARNYIQQKYTWDVCIEKFDKIIEKF